VTVNDAEQGYLRVPTRWQRFRFRVKWIAGAAGPPKASTSWQRFRYWAMWIAGLVLTLLVTAYIIAMIVSAQGDGTPPPPPGLR
jgi:hypothetical protein